MDDALVIAQVVGGHRDAFRLLVLRYERPVFRLLRTFALPEAVVEEVAQETFLRAYKRLSSFNAARGTLVSWLLTIAKRLACNELDRAGLRYEVHEEPPPKESAHEATCEERERRRLLLRALRELPAELRNVVVLSVQELSLEEIATIEGCAVGTVKSRLHRAKERLRALLPAAEEEMS